jgi:hypothetical protein
MGWLAREFLKVFSEVKRLDGLLVDGSPMNINSQANQRNGAVAKESSSREHRTWFGSASHPMFQDVALSRGIEISDVLREGGFIQVFKTNETFPKKTTVTSGGAYG